MAIYKEVFELTRKAKLNWKFSKWSVDALVEQKIARETEKMQVCGDHDKCNNVLSVQTRIVGIAV